MGLTKTEEARGFTRPVRMAYVHTKEGCGASTTMGLAAAEALAKNPASLESLPCSKCKAVLAVAEFVWGDGSRVGT